MQARFPGTCRDCGNKFPAGTDIHYDRRTKKASCCNGTPAPKADGGMKATLEVGKWELKALESLLEQLDLKNSHAQGYVWLLAKVRHALKGTPQDTPPVAPAPQHITGCDGNHTGEHCVLDIGPYIPVEEPAPQADMTSEEMWESMASVNQPTITTSWN